MLSFEHSSSSNYCVTWPIPSSRRPVQSGNQLSEPSVTPKTPALGITKVTERPGRLLPLSFNDALKQLQSFTESDSKRSFTVSQSVFDEIMDKLWKYPELHNLRYDFREHDMSLIVFNPSVGHEIMAPLGAIFSEQKPDNVELGGTCLMPLSNGGKSPDFSIFSDENPDPKKRFQKVEGKGQIIGFPTVVIEVGYSEKPRNLAEDCGRWIACSLGRVRLAIGINIDYTLTTDTNTGELDRKITSISCFTWEIKQVEKDVMADPGERINALRRADGDVTQDVTHYSCLCRIGDKLYRFHSRLRHTYKVFPGKIGEDESIRIQRKHVYRSRSTDPNAVIFNVKLMDIRKAAMSLQRLQELKDYITSSLKRKQDGDGLDEPTRRLMRIEIDNLQDGLQESDEE